MLTHPKLRPSVLIAATIAAATLIAACASKGTPPIEQLATSRAALSQAEAAGAREFAPVELYNAREKLVQADAASQKEDYGQALLLAEQSEAESRLAEAKARTGKAQAAVQELRRSIETLRSEIERARR
jgi:hypothetical protein